MAKWNDKWDCLEETMRQQRIRGVDPRLLAQPAAQLNRREARLGMLADPRFLAQPAAQNRPELAGPGMLSVLVAWLRSRLTCPPY